MINPISANRFKFTLQGNEVIWTRQEVLDFCRAQYSVVPDNCKPNEDGMMWEFLQQYHPSFEVGGEWT